MAAARITSNPALVYTAAVSPSSIASKYCTSYGGLNLSLDSGAPVAFSGRGTPPGPVPRAGEAGRGSRSSENPPFPHGCYNTVRVKRYELLPGVCRR